MHHLILFQPTHLKQLGSHLAESLGLLLRFLVLLGFMNAPLGVYSWFLKWGLFLLSPDFMLLTYPFLIMLYSGGHGSTNISLYHLLTINVSKEDSMVSPYASLLILHHLIYPKHTTLRLLSMMISPQVGKILLQSLLGFLYPAGKTLRIILR